MLKERYLKIIEMLNDKSIKVNEETFNKICQFDVYKFEVFEEIFSKNLISEKDIENVVNKILNTDIDFLGNPFYNALSPITELDDELFDEQEDRELEEKSKNAILSVLFDEQKLDKLLNVSDETIKTIFSSILEQGGEKKIEYYISILDDLPYVKYSDDIETLASVSSYTNFLTENKYLSLKNIKDACINTGIIDTSDCFTSMFKQVSNLNNSEALNLISDFLEYDFDGNKISFLDAFLTSANDSKIKNDNIIIKSLKSFKTIFENNETEMSVSTSASDFFNLYLFPSVISDDSELDNYYDFLTSIFEKNCDKITIEFFNSIITNNANFKIKGNDFESKKDLSIELLSKVPDLEESKDLYERYLASTNFESKKDLSIELLSKVTNLTESKDLYERYLTSTNNEETQKLGKVISDFIVNDDNTYFSRNLKVKSVPIDILLSIFYSNSDSEDLENLTKHTKDDISSLVDLVRAFQMSYNLDEKKPVNKKINTLLRDKDMGMVNREILTYSLYTKGKIQEISSIIDIALNLDYTKDYSTYYLVNSCSIGIENIKFNKDLLDFLQNKPKSNNCIKLVSMTECAIQVMDNLVVCVTYLNLMEKTPKEIDDNMKVPVIDKDKKTALYKRPKRLGEMK